MRELVGLAVVFTLAAPRNAAAASVPACSPGFDVPGLRIVDVFRRGGDGTSQGAKEENGADLPFEYGKNLNIGVKDVNLVSLCRDCDKIKNPFLKFIPGHCIKLKT